MTYRLEEKRRYLRLNVELEIEYVLANSSQIRKTSTRDISALGLRFATNDELKQGLDLELKLKLPNLEDPIHALGRIIWIKKLTPEEGASYEVGVEFSKIEEDNKNTFLRYLCDLIYG